MQRRIVGAWGFHACRLWAGLALCCVSAWAAPGSLFEGPPAPSPTNKIDQLVFGKLRELKIQPAALCSDSVFVRRVFLDVLGTLPTSAEAQKFIWDRNAHKREALIETVLARDEYADYWAMKWSDLLRVKAEFPINLWPNAAQGYYHWIRESLRQNTPCDQFARSLLTASGSDFDEPPVNFYRALRSKDPFTIGQTVALTFMGTRVEKWPATQRTNLAAFFSNIGYKSTKEWKEEIVFFDPRATNALAVTDAPRQAVFPDGTPVKLIPGKDPRAVFADWLVAPRNPWFARSLANRVWSWLLGRGIIEEPDDIRPDNPPSNPELLAYLEGELVKSNYDLKRLFRLILNSSAYQLASVPRSDDPRAATNFASYPLRRLDAEVLLDAIDRLTGATESYSSAIPEPYTFIPPGQRSIDLPDGSITSAFLEMFGRPPRDTGLESERNNAVTPAQELWLLNSTLMRQKLEQNRGLTDLTGTNTTPAQTLNALYLGILSRFPTVEEARTAQAYFQTSKLNRHEAAVDVAWALINSDEFRFRH